MIIIIKKISVCLYRYKIGILLDFNKFFICYQKHYIVKVKNKYYINISPDLLFAIGM